MRNSDSQDGIGSSKEGDTELLLKIDKKNDSYKLELVLTGGYIYIWSVHVYLKMMFAAGMQIS